MGKNGGKTWRNWFLPSWRISTACQGVKWTWVEAGSWAFKYLICRSHVQVWKVGTTYIDISSQVGHVNTAKCIELVPVVLLCKQKQLWLWMCEGCGCWWGYWFGSWLDDGVLFDIAYACFTHSKINIIINIKINLLVVSLVSSRKINFT